MYMYFAAVCEKCGAIGVKHAFYTKERRFCSLACAREYSELERTGQTIRKPYPLLDVSYFLKYILTLLWIEYTYSCFRMYRDHKLTVVVLPFSLSFVHFISLMKDLICYKMTHFADQCSCCMP